MRAAETTEFEQLALALPRPKLKRKKKRGRPVTGKRRDPRHRTRPRHSKHHPVHVVLRVLPDVARLRKRETYIAIRAALRAVARDGFRVVHASIQHNHLHFIVEAEDRRVLSRGVQALTISLARRINRACGRRGRVFAYRFHETAITTPRQTRNALAYVLNNWRHHKEHLGSAVARATTLDPYATGAAFDGWRESWSWFENWDSLPSSAPETWLLRVGWRRAGPSLSVHAVPA